MRTDVLVVGAGFAGSVCARRLAEVGVEVVVIDRRDHIGGNAYDKLDSNGVQIHAYGPHIFHTRARRIFDYLSQFTEWRHYEHRVLASVEGKLLPIPINRTTINKLYDLDLDERGVAAFLERVCEPREQLLTSEDVVLSAVGRVLCDTFFRDYTRKQWGLDLAELSPSVAARIPVRTNDDDRYFTDEHQAMPAEGYTPLFRRMLDHPRIRVETGVAYGKVKTSIRRRHTVYTGPVDEYFEFCHGALPYRSLRFEFEHHARTARYQSAAVVNYPSRQVPFTRITEYKYLTGQCHSGTTISREYSSAEGDPYYPVPSPTAARAHTLYRGLVASERHVTFVGRLAEYRYYNMDQVVAAALKASESIARELNVGKNCGSCSDVQSQSAAR